jgi:Domain of unknown function (DUF6378)
MNIINENEGYEDINYRNFNKEKKMPNLECHYLECGENAVYFAPNTEEYYCGNHIYEALNQKYETDKDESNEEFNPEISGRQEILETALEFTTGDRNKTYGPPKPNLTCFANLVQAYLNGMTQPEQLDATDGAIIMTLAKISRIAVNKQHKDNYIDGAAYMAIAGECAE